MSAADEGRIQRTLEMREEDSVIFTAELATESYF